MPQQQRPKTASKKRSNEEAWNGCPEKKEKLDSETAGAETTPTKQDKEDGIGMSVELRTDERRESFPCCVQSLLREGLPLRPGQPVGNLLKAHEHGKGQKTITVNFTGTSPHDQLTSFLLVKDEDTVSHVFKYCSGKDNYYLAVRKARPDVIFRRLQNFPRNEKYLFRLKGVNENDYYLTIQSVKNKEYLCCEENGNVSMKVAGKKMSDGVPEDRAMWFSFLQHKTYTKISLSLIVSCNDHEDTGEKQTTAHESGPADDLEKEAPKGPGEQHITEDNDQGEREDSQRGKHEGPEEGEHDQGKTEDLAGGNSEGLKDVCNADQREGDSEGTAKNQ